MHGKSKILDYSNEWYYEIDPNSFYEKDLENTILSKIESVYPNYVGVPYAYKVTNPEGESSTPDFVLIKKDYSEWYVIEVEMSRHSWENHVEKQVRVFSSGIYHKDEVAANLHKKDNSLDLDQLKTMIDKYPPKVMVIVNERKPDWEVKIKKYNALLSIFQIYKGTEGFDVYRVDGETPIIMVNKSPCRFLKGGSNILEVFAPEFIYEGQDSILEIIYNGKITLWTKQEEKDKVYLISFGSNILPIDKKYVLYQSEQNEYYLRIN